MKPKKLTRASLLALANRIYDPKTRKFMRLCKGKLTNGPDPQDSSRQMHCGLGELYFYMTGRHPHQDHLREHGVVERVIRQSSLVDQRDQAAERMKAAIKKLKLPGIIELDAFCSIDKNINQFSSFKKVAAELMIVLGRIPRINDSVCTWDKYGCSYETYRKRACHVAALLRKAAKLLPK